MQARHRYELLTILALGRSFAILPRSEVASGYIDAQVDDFEVEPWKRLQAQVLNASIRTMSADVQTAEK